ncbi:MAG: nitrogenase-associated protein [Methylococcales bacterium]|nr:nitrogenase-associated protein [Methylococcales bacterium]
MALITFYEKPGCANNLRQKKLLVAAGHQLIEKSILTEAWQAEHLRAFFGTLAVRDWFNYSAPAIKYGELDPGALTEQEALALMVDNPLLIRRPLMQSGDTLMAGFDPQAVEVSFGMVATSSGQDLETCRQPPAKQPCGHE